MSLLGRLVFPEASSNGRSIRQTSSKTSNDYPYTKHAASWQIELS